MALGTEPRSEVSVRAGVAWSESVLAGCRWLHLVGERTAVFHRLGELARDEIHAVQAALPERTALRRWSAGASGSAVVERLRRAAERDYPEVLRELEALAAGAGIDAADLLIANLRGDVGVPDGTGCTDLAVDAGSGFVAHNEDGAPALDGTFMFVTLGIDQEPSVTTQWYPGFIPCNAHVVTSAGLAWGINHIQVREPAAAAGRHFLARRLQSVADLDQATDWLTRRPTSGGFAYTLGEIGSGRSVVVETAAGRSAVRPVRGRTEWHTNHLRWLPEEIDAAPHADATDSHGLREESLARGEFLEALPDRSDADADWIFSILSERGLPHGVRRRAADGDPLMTLMTTVIDLRRKRVLLRERGGERADLAVDDYLRLAERDEMQRLLTEAR